MEKKRENSPSLLAPPVKMVRTEQQFQVSINHWDRALHKTWVDHQFKRTSDLGEWKMCVMTKKNLK